MTRLGDPQAPRRAAWSRLRAWLWWSAIAAVAVVLVTLYSHYVLSDPGLPFTARWGLAEYRLVAPRWLGLILVLPLLMLGLTRSLADLAVPQRVLLLLSRTLWFAVVAVALSRPVRTVESQRIASVVLIDVSDSVPDEALADARAAAQELRAARRVSDRVEIVTFAAAPRHLALTADQALPAAAMLRHAGNAQAPRPGAGTDLEAALEFAYGLMPPGYLRRVVVLSDGRETLGDAVGEVARARTLGVQVFSIPYRHPPSGEVAVVDLELPKKVDVGQTFKVIGRVYASRKTAARAQLFQGETLNGLGGTQELDLQPGENRVVFESVARVGGEVTYRLELDRASVDRFPDNNVFAATIDVPGRPRVLLVEGQPAYARYLSGALTAQQFDVDVRGADAFPGSMEELSGYDFVVLSDVPREALRREAEVLIERYVRDVGGGFLFAGGEQGFGLGGWSQTLLEQILPVRMDVQRRRDTPGVAMVLVIDRSGSMTGLPIEMSKAACRATLETLSGEDLIEVIAFDSSPKRYVKTQPARYRARIQNEILAIEPGGGTEIFRALDMAYQDVSAVQARKKHVILLTDGQAPKEGVLELASAMLAESITVTTVGLGSEVDKEFLAAVASSGGGRFHHVPEPNSLPRIFTHETEMVARQAAVEEWFPVQQTMGAAFLRGVAVNTAPLLHGYVATELKPPPAQLVLASDRGEPILARWRVGLGHALAWTSDIKNRWAVEWLTWPGFGKFWGQLVREHMRQKRRHQESEMTTEVVGDEVRAVIDAFTPNDRFDNDLDAQLTVRAGARGAAAKSKNPAREFAMRQTAPGRYEARLRLDEYGSFLLRSQQSRETSTGAKQPVGESFGHVSNPYPREYASFEPDIERMTRIGRVGGGGVDPQPRAVFDPGHSAVRHFEPLWPRFVLLALGLLVVDLLLRRVRLFDRQFRHT